MGSSVDVRHITAGYNEIRNSARVKEELKRRAEKVKAAAGSGFIVRDASGATRGRYMVVPDTPQARKAEARDKVLSKALGAGSG